MAQKTYVLVGGGSGGHITPLIAVAEQLKLKDPSCRVVHIGHRGDHLNEVTRKSSVIDEVYEVSAGKFRRYHGESLLSHVLDVKTLALNSRDFFRVVRGIAQAKRLLKKIKPKNIMMKGGYVCVPTGIAAHRTGHRFFTHDSDVTSGLANRIIAKWAYLHARGMPLTPAQQTDSTQVFTGIPLQDAFHPDNQKTQEQYKNELELSGKKIIFVVGGGLGARNVNQSVVALAEDLLAADKKRVLIHVTGKNLYDETKAMYISSISSELFESQVKLLDFTTELDVYAGAADIVVTRAGATNLAEFAVLGKACVVIPNPVLTGGQQLHNAKVFVDQDAIVVVDEKDLSTDVLQKSIEDLLDDPHRQAVLSSNIKKLARPDAASVLADMLIQDEPS